MSDIVTIRLPSRFDYAYHKQFSDAYAVHLDNPTAKEIVLDFSQVEYLDSSALGMMVLIHKKMKDRNKITKIKGAQGATADILKMANMHKLFDYI